MMGRIALYLSLLFACYIPPLIAQAQWYSDTQGIMGTEVNVTLWASSPEKGHKAIKDVMAEMQRINDTLSPYLANSDLSQLNSKAYTAPQALSDELVTLIDKALWYARVSQGAFDITFAAIGQYYDYRKAQTPNKQQFEEALPAFNYRMLALDHKARTLRYKHPQVRIDLGGIAKGYAIDQALSILAGQGIEHASVSAGGDSGLLGDRRGRPWVIGIKNPRSAENLEDAVIRLPLQNTALSTSGDYERYFIDNKTGERIHHIINPATGRSANSVMSVTIIGDKGLDTDPLSTTVFVLGVEKGLDLVNKIPGYDAVIIDIHGKVHYSNGLTAG